MKSSLSQQRNRRIIPILVPLAALLLIIIQPNDPGESSKGKLYRTAIRNLIQADSKDSQLIAYNRINDSLQNTVRWKEQRIKGQGTGLFVLFGGITTINECDTCLSPDEKATMSKHFITLDGFALKEDDDFRIEQNDYIIDKFVVDKKTGLGETGHTEQVKVGVRLAERGNDSKPLTVLIPVSGGSYTIARIITFILFALAVIAAIGIFIRLPIKLLMNIAKGKAFEKENSQYLNWMGGALIGYALISTIIPKIAQLLLSSKLGGSIYYPFWSSLFDHRWMIFLGIMILMMGRAFKQGYQLKQEHDFTL